VRRLIRLLVVDNLRGKCVWRIEELGRDGWSMRSARVPGGLCNKRSKATALSFNNYWLPPGCHYEVDLVDPPEGNCFGTYQ
jgi:hypothetical protein